MEIWTVHWLRKDTFKVRAGARQVGTSSACAGGVIDAGAASRLGAGWTVQAQHPTNAAAARPFLAPQGRVSVPLRDVIERRRIRDTWQLQGPGRREEGQGRLTMELSWMGALAM